MKKKRLLVAICVGFAIASIALMCQTDDANGIDNVMHFQRTFDLNRDSLGSEMWLEVEKNDSLNICMDSKVRAWETSLETEILNDSCLKVQIPTLIGVNTINVKFPGFYLVLTNIPSKTQGCFSTSMRILKG